MLNDIQVSLTDQRVSEVQMNNNLRTYKVEWCSSSHINLLKQNNYSYSLQGTVMFLPGTFKWLVRRIDLPLLMAHQDYFKQSAY